MNDPQNRRVSNFSCSDLIEYSDKVIQVYDLHGVWPPPEPDSTPFPHRNDESYHRSYSHHRYHTPRNNAFPDPFFGNRDPFSFVFTDPFSLFDSIFGFDRHHQPSQYHHRSNLSRAVDPFGRMEIGFNDMFDRGLGSSFGIYFPTPEPAPLSDNGRGNWAEESFMTTTVNGVTQSVRKRRDWDVCTFSFSRY